MPEQSFFRRLIDELPLEARVTSALQVRADDFSRARWPCLMGQFASEARFKSPHRLIAHKEGARPNCVDWELELSLFD